MTLHNKPSLRQCLARRNDDLVASSVLFILLLTLSRLTLAEQQQHGSITSGRSNHNSQSDLDEEITIEARHDYEKASADHIASQTTRDVTTNAIFLAAADQRQSPVQIFDHNDPFAVTFEEYLREASKSSAHHIANNDVNDSSFSSSSPLTAIPDTAGLIIEEDENLLKPKESPIIDYIFPPSKQETLHSHHKQDSKQMNKQEQQLENKDLNASELLNEIRLLFAWKQLPTNKCSKTCGKGFRVNHLSCVDLKYDVRVEEELCKKSNLPRPNETSDEPCNEIDCLPQWTSVEFQECNPVASQNGICHPNLYKRVQCTMINKSGVSVYLDDSKCNSTMKSAANPVYSINETQSVFTETKSEPLRNSTQILDDDNMEISIYDTNERNDILSNIDVGGAVESILHGSSKTKDHPFNEPFFETGPWSECSGAPCGQLGKRFRKLSCRLYLSRSSKFAELPDSGCHNVHVPDSQEPCYMDCASDTDSSSKNVSSIKFDNDESTDETVYDLEMARFNWRKDGWTKCSADCLGGQRESIIECWDKVAETTVDSSLCDQEMKPQAITETCNDVPCQPEWKVGAFSECNKPCGSAGTKFRSIACEQQVPSQRGPSYMKVSNDLCIQTNGTTPHTLEPCNRVDCKPEWSVGPWSECNEKCGEGVKNRTVICVQEFANRDGPRPGASHKYPYKVPSPDLIEAITVSAKNWHPGKVTQVPFQECYEEYRTVPALDEKCFNFCDEEPYIDADTHQNYRMTKEALKRKFLILKIGGKAEVLEGQNLKIRCRIMNRQLRENLVKKIPEQVEWRKDGIKIFVNGSKMAEKQYIQDDNSILGNDVISADENNQYMADEPNSKRSARPTMSLSQSRPRNRILRSWADFQDSYLEPQGNFTFVPQVRGRFSLVKENTLRIKRLRPDDSGSYTCSYGSLSKSMELKVVRKLII